MHGGMAIAALGHWVSGQQLPQQAEQLMGL